jgi:hypothetical protein
LTDAGWLYRELDEGEGCLEVAEDDRIGAQALSEEWQHGARHLRAARKKLACFRARHIQEAFAASTQNVMAYNTIFMCTRNNGQATDESRAPRKSEITFQAVILNRSSRSL